MSFAFYMRLVVPPSITAHIAQGTLVLVALVARRNAALLRTATLIEQQFALEASQDL